jgi:hypothetical protein
MVAPLVVWMVDYLVVSSVASCLYSEIRISVNDRN